MPPNPPNVQGTLCLQTPAPLHVRRYVRNGLIPHAIFESEVGAALNFCGAVRNRELFSWGVPLTSIPGAGGDRVRWRAAAHTGPLLRRLRATICAARNDADALEPSCTIYVTNADQSVTYGSAEFVYGNNFGTAPGNTPDEFGIGELIIGGVPADTDVYLRIDDNDHGRIVSVTIHEESKKLLASNGYLLPSVVSVGGPIDDARRGSSYALATSLWKRGAAHLFNWTVDLDASKITTTGGTFKNIVDNSSTSVSAATPGWTLDLRYCRTLGQTTVPCVFKCYGSATVGDTAEVSLVDSGGSPVATISVNSPTNGWFSATVNLPATLAKYDVHYADPDGGTISLGACSLYQYAA